MVAVARVEASANVVIGGSAGRQLSMTAPCSSDPWTACSCGPLDAQERIAHHVAVACRHLTDRIVVWRASREPGAEPTFVEPGRTSSA